MTTKYEKTSNPNIINKIEMVESEIYLNKLTEQVRTLEEEIKNTPEPKTEPDLETLNFFNMQNEMMFDKEDLEMQLKEKKDLLERLTGL